MAFRYNTTYSPDWDTDIKDLRVRDLGDIGGHLTDVSIAHGNIEGAVRDALTVGGPFIPVIIGGDHSITAPAVRGFCCAQTKARRSASSTSTRITTCGSTIGDHTTARRSGS